MRQTLLLTSQGIQPEVKDVFLDILPKSPEDIRVSFITTAAYGEEKDPFWLENARSELRACGITRIEDLDIKDKSEEKLASTLNGKDIIFVNGGNTFYLLYWMRRSGFNNIIYDLLHKGRIYVGISAGGIVTGPSVEIASWKGMDKNVVKIKDFNGLNLVPFGVFPHYAPKYQELVKRNMRTVSYPIIALTDTQAVLVKNETYAIVGKGEKVVYNE